MIWRRLTVSLVCAIVGVCASVYLRDRSAPGPPLSGREQAQLAADELANLVESSNACDRTCSGLVLGQNRRGDWNVEVSSSSVRHCYSVQLSRFAYTTQHGVTGLSAEPCVPEASAAG